MGSRQLALIALAVALAIAPGAQAAGWLLGKAPTGGDADLLPADDALRLQPALWQDGRLIVGIDAAPGCYLYRDKIRIEALKPTAYALGKIELPTGEAHHDEHFGDVRILRGAVIAAFHPSARTPPAQLRVTYQGCMENRVCYPPQTRIVDVVDTR